MIIPSRFGLANQPGLHCRVIYQGENQERAVHRHLSAKQYGKLTSLACRISLIYNSSNLHPDLLVYTRSTI